MRKPRAPDLTEETIGLVVDLLDGWTGKLTWDALIARVAQETGHEYSRFTFADYPRIADAFTLRKRALSGQIVPGRGAPKDAQVAAALAQVERFRAKAERLERENAVLLEQFITWATNAEQHNVTIDKLNAPVPTPNREQSKVKK